MDAVADDISPDLNAVSPFLTHPQAALLWQCSVRCRVQDFYSVAPVRNVADVRQLAPSLTCSSPGAGCWLWPRPGEDTTCLLRAEHQSQSQCADTDIQQ